MEELLLLQHSQQLLVPRSKMCADALQENATEGLMYHSRSFSVYEGFFFQV